MSTASRQLCAALGVLAEDCYIALGGTTTAAEVGRAAGLLALLTKIDDEVIDAQAFHGGPLRESDDAALETRTRAYLQPTLDSLRHARPTSSEPRCRLAAEVGLALCRLSGTRARLDDLLDVIATGWEVQVRAVGVLSRHPGRSTEHEVAEVTAQISGYWLLMITMIGSLPAGAARPLDAAERRAFLAWGSLIQRADALSDFGKDMITGLANSYAGHTLWRRDPTGFETRCREGDVGGLYERLRATGADGACLPASSHAFDPLMRALGGLGAVPHWLRFIHGFLTLLLLIDDPVGNQLSCQISGPSSIDA